jgi:hypothetical protein
MGDVCVGGCGCGCGWVGGWVGDARWECPSGIHINIYVYNFYVYIGITYRCLHNLYDCVCVCVFVCVCVCVCVCHMFIQESTYTCLYIMYFYIRIYMYFGKCCEEGVRGFRV